MRGWPLRLKIALWSALVMALVLLISGFATSEHFYHEDLELFDRLARREVRGLFEALEHLPKKVAEDPGKLPGALPSYKHQLVQVRRGGRVVYQSDRTAPDAFGAENLTPGTYTTGTKRKLRMTVAEKGPWQVRVAFETRQLLDAMQELLRGFLLASPALLVVTALGGWWIARQALAPISAVTKAAEQITAERLEVRLPVPESRDEVWRLSLVLNQMIERLERSFRQAQRFSADTSHELRTPLAVLHAGLENMLASPDTSDRQQQQLRDLLDASTRLTSLSEKLLLLARADAGFLEISKAPVDLIELLAEAVEEASIFAESGHIRVESIHPPHLLLHADPFRLLQVLRNLLENAVKYNRPEGKVRIVAAVEGASAKIRITNTGARLQPEESERLFSRFYRAEVHRGSPGHGLGLSIAREIARAHGGTLALTKSVPDEIEFTLTLPLSAAESQMTDSSHPGSPSC